MVRTAVAYTYLGGVGRGWLIRCSIVFIWRFILGKWPGVFPRQGPRLPLPGISSSENSRKHQSLLIYQTSYIFLALHYCNVYSDDLKKEATSFISYARNAVEAIKQGHWGRNRQGNCPDTFKCDSQKQIKEGNWLHKVHTANSQKCSCEIESSNSKKYCEIRYFIFCCSSLVGFSKISSGCILPVQAWPLYTEIPQN